MSDAIRCPKCGYVYSVSGRENWGTCMNCNSNNDFVEGAMLVDSSLLFRFISEENRIIK